MRISSYKNLVIERSNQFIKDNSVGIVVKTAEEIGENVYGIFIGRMMQGVYTQSGPLEEVVNIESNKCLNSVNRNIGQTSATSSNFIHLNMYAPYNLSMPRLILGERVLVGVIDQDIKSLYIKPFNRDKIKYRPSDILEMYVPASGNYDGEDLSDINKYYVRCDSVNKVIRIHMSNANGEVSQYDLVLDGTNGSASLTDGIRSFVINTANDEILMTNEAGSSITLRESAIDIVCANLYIRASEAISVESPRATLEITDVEQVSDTFSGEIGSVSLVGDSYTEEFSSASLTNDKREVHSAKILLEGVTTCTEPMSSSGINFNGGSGRNMPVDPNITGDGIASLSGPSSMALAKCPPLNQILTQMCVLIDAAGSAGPAILPPTAVASVSPMLGQLMSTSAKG